MKRISIVGVLVCAVVLATGSSALAQWSGDAAESRTPGPTNCLNRLDTNTYTCQVKASFGETFSATLAFSDGTLTPEGLGGTLVCSCATVGTYASPKFNVSKPKWQCVGTDGGGAAYSFSGVVTGNGKLSQVRAANGSGTTYIISCSGP